MDEQLEENTVTLRYKQWPCDFEIYQGVLLNGIDVTDKISHVDVHLGEDMAEEFNRRNLFGDKPGFKKTCGMVYFKEGFVVFCHNVCFEKLEKLAKDSPLCKDKQAGNRTL